MAAERESEPGAIGRPSDGRMRLHIMMKPAFVDWIDARARQKGVSRGLMVEEIIAAAAPERVRRAAERARTAAPA